jgi:class 3 adenylate cyclase
MSGPTTARTRGFLFADLRGFTAFVEVHGDHAAMELLAAYRVLVRGVVARHEGAEIRTEGDSFYVVFPSASAAVRCGLEIVETARTQASGGGPALSIGVGVHAGETAESEHEGLVGSAVNIAARICSVAAPGELLVSDTVRALTRTLLQVRFVPRGTRRLKGVSEPILVYRVERAEGGAPRTTTLSRLGRLRRLLPAASLGPVLALAGLILVLAAVPALYALRGSQAASPPASATAAATPSPGPSTANFSRSEQALLVRLPSSVSGGSDGPNCRETDQGEKATGGTASIRCELPVLSGAHTAWYDAFGDAGQMSSFFLGLGNGDSAPHGDCATATDVIQDGGWSLPLVAYLAGSLRCYHDGTQSWIVWTYDTDQILARAVRADLEEQALYEWWRAVGPFLKK